jgi:hypothetical protein
MSSDRAQTRSARISVTITEFNAIGSGRSCTLADIELTDTGDGTVSQGRINDPIVVSGEVYLNFIVHAGRDDSYSYMPIGIGFRDTALAKATRAAKSSGGRDNRDPLGRAAFPMRTLVSRGDTAQLTLFDANPARAEFDFSLVVQRSDGLLSVVDPQIINRGVMK